jgi:hypothetical protein
MDLNTHIRYLKCERHITNRCVGMHAAFSLHSLICMSNIKRETTVFCVRSFLERVWRNIQQFLFCKHNSLHGSVSFLRNQYSLKWSRNSSPFLEPKDWLPCTQGPATGHHSGSDVSSPYKIPPSSLRSVLIFSWNLRLSFSKRSLPFRFSDKNFVTTYCLFCACYVPHPSTFWFDHYHNIWWKAQFMKLVVIQTSSVSL